MTYKELLEELSKLTPRQLDCNIIVELGPENESYPGELRVVGSAHDFLPEDLPVIFVP